MQYLPISKFHKLQLELFAQTGDVYQEAKLLIDMLACIGKHFGHSRAFNPRMDRAMDRAMD